MKIFQSLLNKMASETQAGQISVLWLSRAPPADRKLKPLGLSNTPVTVHYLALYQTLRIDSTLHTEEWGFLKWNLVFCMSSQHWKSLKTSRTSDVSDTRWLISEIQDVPTQTWRQPRYYISAFLHPWESHQSVLFVAVHFLLPSAERKCNCSDDVS